MSSALKTRTGDVVSWWQFGAANEPENTHMLALQIEESETRAAAGAYLTPTEARQLAAELVKLADEIERAG